MIFRGAWDDHTGIQYFSAMMILGRNHFIGLEVFDIRKHGARGVRERDGDEHPKRSSGAWHIVVGKQAGQRDASTRKSAFSGRART